MPEDSKPTTNPMSPDKAGIMTAMVHGLLTGPGCQAFMRPNALNTGIDLDIGQLAYVGEALANSIMTRAAGESEPEPPKRLSGLIMEDPTKRGH